MENPEASYGLGIGWMAWFLDWDLTVTSSPGGGAVTRVSAVFMKPSLRKWKRFDGLCYQLPGLPSIDLSHFVHAHSSLSDDVKQEDHAEGSNPLLMTMRTTTSLASSHPSPC